MRSTRALSPLVTRSAAALVALVALVLPAVIVLACQAPGPTSRPLPVRDDEGGVHGDDDETNPLPDPTTQPESDPPLPDGGKPLGRVYAHTADTLYLFEPLGKTLTQIGAFSCLQNGDRVLDVALDRDGVMYATSDQGFLKVDVLDATCQFVKIDPTANYPNSLAFVPLGTVDPTREALVGYQFDPETFDATDYVRIDLSTGAMTKIGDLNDPDAGVQYKSSGDIVALIRDGNRAFLTVQTVDPDADGGPGTDALAEVDPATGKIKSIIGNTGKTNIFGLGQWAGTGFGFSSTGEILQIDMTTGLATTISTLTLDGGGIGQWFGAGVTTDAPTKP